MTDSPLRSVVDPEDERLARIMDEFADALDAAYPDDPRPVVQADCRVIAQRLRAPRYQKALSDETAWLIERGTAENVMGQWWTGAGFTIDTKCAVRFARKRDAEAVMERCSLDNCVATEHMWVNA